MADFTPENKTMSLRETILSTLYTQLSVLPAMVLRGDVMPERVPRAGLVILRDGEPGEPEVTVSPLMYHFRHRAELEVIVQGGNLDADFDSLCGTIGVLLFRDPTLNGLCDWIEAGAPRTVDLYVDGGASLKAAEIALTLHYSSSNPLA